MIHFHPCPAVFRHTGARSSLPVPRLAVLKCIRSSDMIFMASFPRVPRCFQFVHEISIVEQICCIPFGAYIHTRWYIYIYVALDWYKQLPWTLETLAVICPWGKNCIPSGWSNVACWKTSPCSIDLKGRYNTSWVLPKHVIEVPWQNDND